MSSTVTLKASGLATSPNQLETPDGALTTASNVIIRRQDVIEPRRGFKLFGTTFGDITDVLKQIYVYKGRIIRHYGNTLEFDAGTLTNAGEELFSAFSGSFAEAQAGLRTKFVESNGNLYFTSSEGIKKISALTASSLSSAPGFVTPAGGVKAIDITGSLDVTLGNITGFLPQDSAVAYRAVWATKDANSNLVLGTPSQRTEIFNPLLGLLLLDYNNVVGQIQNTANAVAPNVSLINDGNYASTLLLSSSASAIELYNKLLSLVTKLDADLLYANSLGSAPLNISSAVIINATPSNLCTITFSSGDPTQYFAIGSNIFLSGFADAENTTGTTNNINGGQVVTSVTSTTLTFTTTATGNTQTFLPGGVDTAGDIITIPSHGFESSDPIRFTSTITLPAPLLVNTTYFVGNVTTDTFKVYTDISLTSLVNLTTTGSGVHTVSFFMDVATSAINSNEFTIITQPNAPIFPTTDDMLVSLQTYLESIIEKLQGFPSTGTPPTISAYSQTNFINPITITTTANTTLQITIPQQVTTAHFLQIYRSAAIQATGVAVLANLTPSDEMQLVYEAFPTSAELAARTMTVEDITPDSFRGANLYTNESSGEGITQANDVPPFALDVNRFKNVIFFANTRTPYRELISLLGVSKMIEDYGNGIIPTLTISNGTTSNTYKFIEGISQVTQVTTIANTAAVLNGKYWLINSADDTKKYYVWYSSQPTPAVDPAVTGRIGIPVFINSSDSAATIANNTTDALNSEVGQYFTATVSSNVITVTNAISGYTTSPTAGTSGFTVSVLISGQGQNASNKEILLSSNISPAKAVDETARSMVSVINQNLGESVYAYYLSGTSSIPGQMLLESRSLGSAQFYLATNDSNAGSSFNPDLSPKITITSITVGNPSVNVVTTAIPHGLVNSDQVMITGTDSTPNVNGLWTIVYLSPTTFRITTTITVAATTGSIISANDSVAGSNETKINRIYYSKLQQPESVPVVNFEDVGAADKAILRIVPSRSSLFVFKEDGLYRLSGESSPFTVDLFDSSCILTAPDSVAIVNNQLFAWTTQGIVSITEAGVSSPPMSRPIDNEILKLGSSNYASFSTATWGLGYQSDNSYFIFTVQKVDDTIATIGYRYSTLTNSWTTIDKSDTCGTVNSADDKLYLGAGDINSLEQERKTFTRLDYADREYVVDILTGAYAGTTSLRLTDVSNIEVGDVLVQTQSLSLYTFNALLSKLDLDPALVTSTILSISTGTLPIVTTSASHALTTGDKVLISGTNTTPNIDGLYTVTVTGANTFTLSNSKQVLTAGTAGMARYQYTANLTLTPGADLELSLTALTNRLNKEPGLLFKRSTLSITSNSMANPTVVTTSTAHGLGEVGSTRIVRISGASGSTPSINNDYTATILSLTTLSLPVNVTVSGTGGTLTTLDDYESIVELKSTAISNIPIAEDLVVITAPNHGMIGTRFVSINGTNSTPSIDGNYTATIVDRNTFTIPGTVTLSGSTGLFSTITGNFQDIEDKYNTLMTTLNRDSGTGFKNYKQISSEIIQEDVVLGINTSTKTITLNIPLPYVVGPITIFKAIRSEFTYAPVTFKDTLSLKQVSEATLMFENKAFTQASLSFSSDLIPGFTSITFTGDGNGAFGLGTGPFGGKPFGGGSTAAPFRTYIPRQNQRCRYIVPRFVHRVARESYAINGLTLTGNIQQSTRAYR